MHNESEGAELFHNILLPAMKRFTKNSFEIIYINDGSNDDTLDILTKLAKNNNG